MGNLITGSLLVIVGVAIGLFTKKSMQEETEFNFGRSLRRIFSESWWQLFITLGLIHLSQYCVDFSTMTQFDGKVEKGSAKAKGNAQLATSDKQAAKAASKEAACLIAIGSIT